MKTTPQDQPKGSYNIWNKWDPLKTVMLGDCYSPSFFHDIKNPRIKSALTQIAEETQEDLAYFEKVLHDFGCEVIRPYLDSSDSILNYINEEGKVKGAQGVNRAPLQPRDRQIVIGNTCFTENTDHFSIAETLVNYNSSKTILSKNLPLPPHKYDEIACKISGDWPRYEDYANGCKLKPFVADEITNLNFSPFLINGANSFLLGDRLLVGADGDYMRDAEPGLKYFLKKYTNCDFNIEFTKMDGHTDGNYHPVKPGAILSLYDVHNYDETFPGWDICYLPDQSWDKVKKFTDFKKQVGGKWWVPDQEDNTEFTQFVETWLQDWVGYVEETVFDVNVLVLDENHVCVNNMNPIVVDFLKKHNMEAVHIPWRHRYFWDGGIHCITLDLYREGYLQNYF